VQFPCVMLRVLFLLHQFIASVLMTLKLGEDHCHASRVQPFHMRSFAAERLMSRFAEEKFGIMKHDGCGFDAIEAQARVSPL
jgi:hypothetical protein